MEHAIHHIGLTSSPVTSVLHCPHDASHGLEATQSAGGTAKPAATGGLLIRRSSCALLLIWRAA
jgi:hypothetical protein